VTKQMSWLSFFSYTGSPAPRRSGALRASPSRRRGTGSARAARVEGEEEIRLVLRRVREANSRDRPSVPADHRIMPGSDPFRPSSSASAGGPEFQVLVAQDARIRRPPRGILPDEGIDHLPPELFPQVQDVIRDPQDVAHAARVVQVVEEQHVPSRSRVTFE